MTPYQEFMSAEFERTLSEPWSEGFDADQALEYCRKMYGLQSEYSDDLVRGTSTWQSRFGKPKAQAMAAPAPKEDK